MNAILGTEEYRSTKIFLLILHFFLLSFQINTEWKVSVFGVFLVLIFSHLDWVRRDTYLPVFSLNAGKYRPEKLWKRRFFRQCEIHIYFIDFKYSVQLDAEYWYHRPNSPKLWRNCFPQNFHTRKLGEITVFYVL